MRLCGHEGRRGSVSFPDEFSGSFLTHCERPEHSLLDVTESRHRANDDRNIAPSHRSERCQLIRDGRPQKAPEPFLTTAFEMAAFYGGRQLVAELGLIIDGRSST